MSHYLDALYKGQLERVVIKKVETWGNCKVACSKCEIEAYDLKTREKEDIGWMGDGGKEQFVEEDGTVVRRSWCTHGHLHEHRREPYQGTHKHYGHPHRHPVQRRHRDYPHPGPLFKQGVEGEQSEPVTSEREGS